MHDDDKGFISIDETLQCVGTPNVFAVGDVASSVSDPRPKAGVFAVRQGPALADNLRRLLLGESLQPFRPQSSFLSLISTGPPHAIAVKGWLCIEGNWLWAIKDWIDRSWMARYSAPSLSTSMPSPTSTDAAQFTLQQQASAAAAGSEATVVAAEMRCSGCASKIGSASLSQALQRLRSFIGASAAVVEALSSPDDACVLPSPPPGHVSIQTVDFFPAVVSDPYVNGRIAAEHALGDCYAMGAAPSAALAIAVMPFAAPAQVEEELFQMLAGAASVLGPAQCALIGGHSGEGQQAALGFSVTGTAPADALLRKGGLRPGQALILTKAIGTGVILAAHMRLKAKGPWLQGATASMQQSSGDAAECLKRFSATAATDVTGFGLLGHLHEMCEASQVGAEVYVDSVPLQVGAQQAAADGTASSLQPANEAAAAAAVSNAAVARHLPQWPLLTDPQTGGGLLAGMPAEDAQECVEELCALGYSCAAVIGHTVQGPPDIDVVE